MLSVSCMHFSSKDLSCVVVAGFARTGFRYVDWLSQAEWPVCHNPLLTLVPFQNFVVTISMLSASSKCLVSFEADLQPPN